MTAHADLVEWRPARLGLSYWTQTLLQITPHLITEVKIIILLYSQKTIRTCTIQTESGKDAITSHKYSIICTTELLQTNIGKLALLDDTLTS